MKRIIITALLIFVSVIRVYAAEYSFTQSERTAERSNVSEKWRELVSSLPEEEREELSDIDICNPKESGETVKEKLNFSYWTDKIFSGFLASAKDAVTSFVPIFSLIFIMAIAESMSSSLSSDGIKKTFSTYAMLCVGVSLFSVTYGLIDYSASHLLKLCSIMNFMTGVMEAVYIVEGAITSATVSTQAVMTAITIIGNFAGQILTPLCRALFTLGAVSSVCDESKLNGVASSINKFTMRLIQIMSMVFSFIMGAQSVLTKSADSFGMRAARFAIGSFVPVAGGMISEAYATIKAGTSLIRESAGIGGMIVLLLIFIPGIIPVLIFRFSLFVAGMCADMLGLEKLSSLFSSVKKTAELLCGIILYTSLMFFLSVIIFTKSTAG